MQDVCTEGDRIAGLEPGLPAEGAVDKDAGRHPALQYRLPAPEADPRVGQGDAPVLELDSLVGRPTERQYVAVKQLVPLFN